jgi:hypothetical protein
MLKFLEAGLVAAGRQLVAVAIVTVTTILLAPNKMAVHEASVTGSDAGTSDGSVSPFLPWAYLLTAIGLILITSRSVVMTAERIRYASRLVGPEKDLKVFVVQLGLSTVIFAIFALRPAPEPLIEIGRYFGYASVVTIVWAGSMTVAMAGLGATAHAAARAL